MSQIFSGEPEVDQEEYRNALLGFSFFRAIVRGLPCRIENEIDAVGEEWQKNPEPLEKVLYLVNLLNVARAVDPRIEETLIVAGIEQGAIKIH